MSQQGDARLCFQLGCSLFTGIIPGLCGQRSLASRPLWVQTIDNEPSTHIQSAEDGHTHTHAHTQYMILLRQVHKLCVSSHCPSIYLFCLLFFFFFFFLHDIICPTFSLRFMVIQLWSAVKHREYTTQGQDPDRVFCMWRMTVFTQHFGFKKCGWKGVLKKGETWNDRLWTEEVA